MAPRLYEVLSGNKSKGKGFVIDDEFVAEDDGETYAFEHEEDPEASHFDDKFQRRTRSDDKRPLMIAHPLTVESVPRWLKS